jgi:hypothetical protein
LRRRGAQTKIACADGHIKWLKASSDITSDSVYNWKQTTHSTGGKATMSIQ